jgi:hypothetical protein
MRRSNPNVPASDPGSGLSLTWGCSGAATAPRASASRAHYCGVSHLRYTTHDCIASAWRRRASPHASRFCCKIASAFARPLAVAWSRSSYAKMTSSAASMRASRSSLRVGLVTVIPLAICRYTPRSRVRSPDNPASVGIIDQLAATPAPHSTSARSSQSMGGSDFRKPELVPRGATAAPWHSKELAHHAFHFIDEPEADLRNVVHQFQGMA